MSNDKNNMFMHTKDTLEKLQQFNAVWQQIYKDNFKKSEQHGNYDETDKSVYVDFESTTVMGEYGPGGHVGEIAKFRMYYNEAGEFQLVFLNNGFAEPIGHVKHMLRLLDPINLDLQ